MRFGARCAECDAINRQHRIDAGLTGHVGRHVPTRLRAQVIDEQHGRCVRCGVSSMELKRRTPSEFLECHHRDGNPSHNVRHNLEALCPNCHRVTEGRIGGRR